MTKQELHPDAAERYLTQLRYELRHARRNDRDDYVAQIADHISESRSLIDPADTGELDQLLGRLGSPSILAKEFYVTERSKLNVVWRVLGWLRRWWIAIAVVAVIAIAVCFEVWASTYQPLSLNMNGGYRDTVVAMSGKPPVKLSEGAFQPVTWKLTEGRYRVSILFAAENTNSLPVTISPPQFVQGFPNSVLWQLESNTSTQKWPFVSARVPGHGYREIVVTTTYTCTPWPKGDPNAAGDQTTYINNFPIVMSFWGHQHTLRLAIQPFYLEFAGNCFGN